MLNDYYKYTISDHFLSVIINSDCSGLDDSEERQLDEFFKSIPSDAANGTWDVVDYEGSFDRCEVTGLDANCVTVKLWFHNTNIKSITGV